MFCLLIGVSFVVVFIFGLVSCVLVVFGVLGLVFCIFVVGFCRNKIVVFVVIFKENIFFFGIIRIFGN